MPHPHRFLSLILCLLALSGCARRTSAPASPVDYVNTLAGTLSAYDMSTGNTYPDVSLPWGTHAWTPQTGENGDGWTYRYDARTLQGFKQTHQPSPWINDYGAFSLMPVTTGPYTGEEQRRSLFSHKAEVAAPYYYKVYLATHDVTAELTPSAHAAAFRFTYPECGESYLVIDAYEGGKVWLRDDHTIEGYAVNNHGGVPENFRNSFIIRSDTPLKALPSADDKLLVGFPTQKGQQVQLRVASSFIGGEQAERNLQEVAEGDFESLKTRARRIWNETLSRVEIRDDNLDHLRTFYTCLYRTLLFPRDLAEVDENGRLVHYSPYTGTVEEGHLYTDTGFWDTFRSLFPLMNLLYPEKAAQMQEGLVNVWKESGFLPEWNSPGHRGCMVGNNSASVVADAWLSGLRGYDIDALWEAVVRGAHSVHPTVSSTGRLGWQWYDSLGYVPCDVGINESAARTLEYAYDDWCIAQLGKALGKDVSAYEASARNYRHLFDKEYLLMNGRQADGSFRQPFSPLKWGGDFTEGNSLHYTWSVFHDVAGLMDLMGGPEAFAAQLDTVFRMPPHYDDSYYGFPIHEIREMQVMGMGNYAHGNQPIQHMLYLYDWCGQPWKAQARIREVMEKFYTPWADAYCGDEDNGQTSAWYVFSALGFYPVCPGSGQYALGTPLFRKAVLHLPGGRVVISAPDNAADSPYVKSLRVNGRRWECNYLLQKDLQHGARLRFRLSSQPSCKRGTDPAARPYSLSEE